MTATLVNLVAYTAQLSLVAACGSIAARWSGVRSPRLLLLHYQVTLVLAAGLPLLTLFRPGESSSAGLLTIIAGQAGEPSAGMVPTLAPHVVVDVLVAGAIARFLWLVTGCVRLRFWRRSAVQLDPPPESIARVERALQTRARWYVTDRLPGPATYGFWRPVVLIPSSALAGSPRTLELMIRHELHHVRRRDWLSVIAEECLQCVLWVQPAVWFVLDRIRLYREELIDQEVVSDTGDPQIYARALVAGAGVDWIQATGPAAHWLHARHLRLRIQTVMNRQPLSARSARKWAAVFALTLLASGYSAVHAFPLRPAAAARRVYGSKESGIVLPKVLKQVRPSYTQQALEAQITGTARLSVVVEPDGSVGDIEVVESLDSTYGLDDRAVDAVSQWQFTPGTKDGNAVPVRVEIQLNFVLK